MRHITAICLALLMIATTGSFAQVEHLTTHDMPSVMVERSHGTNNLVHYVARHADGSIFFDQTVHNLRTNAGGDAQGSQMGNTGTQAAACNYIALTNTAVTPAVTDTTLSGEIVANGLSRAQGAWASTSHTSFTITKTFTATGAQSAQAAGLFNAAASGTLCFENTFTQVSLNSTDTLQITWTINY